MSRLKLLIILVVVGLTFINLSGKAWGYGMPGDLDGNGSVDYRDIFPMLAWSEPQITVFNEFASSFGIFYPTLTPVPTATPIPTPTPTPIGPWLNTAWPKRMPVMVTNQSTQPLTQHQVKLTVPFQSGMQNDWRDVRITDTDKVTLLPHWLETVRVGQNADLWVKVSSLPSSGSKTLYIYFGNSNAISVSNGLPTFEFFETFTPEMGIALNNATQFQTTPTYDGSGQAVHPDVVYFPQGWNGWKYWMAMTPYTNTNDQVENPSILVSQDGINWQVPAGLTNPLYPTPPCDHNSDTDLVYNDATGELWVYFLDTRRAHRCSGHVGQPYYNHNQVILMRSSNGINWTAPQVVRDWNLGSNPLHVSPSIVKSGSSWFMWTVKVETATNTPLGVEIAFSNDGLDWVSARAPADVAIQERIWHLDVIRHPSSGEFLMVSSFPSGSGYLRFSTSGETQWTSYPSVLMLPKRNTWNEGLYRSSILFDPATNRLKTWYSARTDAGVWRIGMVEEDYPTLLSRLQTLDGWTKVQGNGLLASSNDVTLRDGASGRVTQETEAAVSVSFTKPIPLLNNMMIEWEMYDDMDQSSLKIARILDAQSVPVGVGIWTGASASKYSYHGVGYSYTPTHVNRTQGWHKFGLALRESTTSFFVDTIPVGTLSNQIQAATRINLGGSKDGATSYYVDDIRVRKYITPEPIVQFLPVE